MSDDSQRFVGRLSDACIGLLLAAMALWGAVEIISSIWVALCILAAVIAIGFIAYWRITTRYRGW